MACGYLGRGAPGSAGGCLVGGMVAEAGVDRLVVAATLSVHEGGQHLSVGVKILMTTKQVQKPDHDPSTWPGFLARLVELGSEDWGRLARVICILIALAWR